MGNRIKLSGRGFDELMRDARIERFLRLNEDGAVPEHIDAAAENAFEAMRAWAAVGAVPAAAGGAAFARSAGGIRHISGLKVAAITVGAAALIGAGGYIASPAVRGAIDSAIQIQSRETGSVSVREAQEQKHPGDYIIPDPGDGFTLREEVAADHTAARWFEDGNRQLMVQIAWQLPEEPDEDDRLKTVVVGGIPGTLYDVDGDKQLILRDGRVVILIKMWQADTDEILAYASALTEANE